MIDTKISAILALGELVRKMRGRSSNDVSTNGDSTIDDSANGGSTNEGSAAHKALKKPNFVIEQLKKNKSAIFFGLCGLYIVIFYLQ